MKKYFTSESVTEGHPDKMCDQISDAILDAIIEKDPNARVACETVVFTGQVLVVGEISCDCYVDIPKIARETVREIGYTRAKFGFDANTCSVLTSIHEQSPDIAQGVDKAYDSTEDAADQVGAGDQGMMFGYATDETKEYMPLALTLAHALTRRLTEVRKTELLAYLRPDGKSQVTVEYEDGTPKRVETVVVSCQHAPEIDIETLRKDIFQHVIRAAIPKEWIDKNTKIYVNPTGKFVTGGPMGDSGLTGRKIIVDTYGGSAGHGGGCFSGKDPTKVDRSAAYMARYICKNLVAAGLAKRCQLEVAYAIGVARPVSVYIDSFGTGALSDEALAEIVSKEFDLRPYAIIQKLDLKKPIYRKTAAYGHFGRDGFSWEKLDKVEDLKKYLNASGAVR